MERALSHYKQTKNRNHIQDFGSAITIVPFIKEIQNSVINCQLALVPETNQMYGYCFNFINEQGFHRTVEDFLKFLFKILQQNRTIL